MLTGVATNAQYQVILTSQLSLTDLICKASFVFPGAFILVNLKLIHNKVRLCVS